MHLAFLYCKSKNFRLFILILLWFSNQRNIAYLLFLDLFNREYARGVIEWGCTSKKKRSNLHTNWNDSQKKEHLGPHLKLFKFGKKARRWLLIWMKLQNRKKISSIPPCTKNHAPSTSVTCLFCIISVKTLFVYFSMITHVYICEWFHLCGMDDDKANAKNRMFLGVIVLEKQLEFVKW